MKLKQMAEYRNRVEIFNEFEFPVSAQNIQMSSDGHYMIATGVYAPMVKIYETSDLAMKCERGMDSEIVKMSIMSDDYSKLAFLQADRNIEIHAQYGKHYKIRVPRYGRDMQYIPFNADLAVCGASNEIWRLNLDQGRFLAPFETASPELTCLAYSKPLNLLACGGIDGVTEFWSMDGKTKVIDLPVKDHSAFTNYDLCGEVSALAFSDDGMNVAIGNENGKVRVFDLRYPIPKYELNLHYRKAVKTLKFHEKSRTLWTNDTKQIKIFEAESGKYFTTIQKKVQINDFEICHDSGLCLLACSEPKMSAFFIPQIGQAPEWIPHLDNITEEVEEKKISTAYEDFKFVTKNDLEQLHASHLIGTGDLKAYMHGYFMNTRMYKKLLEAADPFAFEKYREKKVQDRLKELADDRIAINTGFKKVNTNFDKLVLKEDRKLSKKKRREAKEKQKLREQVMQDDRFKNMFTDANFQRDDED